MDRAQIRKGLLSTGSQAPAPHQHIAKPSSYRQCVLRLRGRSPGVTYPTPGWQSGKLFLLFFLYTP